MKSKAENKTSKKSVKVKETKEKPLRFSIGKSESGKTVISISEYRGRMLLDFRHYYKDRKSGEWLPTKKGTSVPANLSVKVMRRLKKLIESATQQGITTQDDE